MHPSRSVVSAACLTLLLGSALLPTFSAAASSLSDAPATADMAFVGTAPALMLAGVWPAGHSPRDYLVSEKLDGVRAFWDGQSLRFRSGRVIAAPGWFISALPKTALDGELWLGRGRFDELSGMVRREVPVDADWRQVRYMIFDVPGGSEPFAKRAQTVERVVAQVHQPWLQAVSQQQVADAPALQVLLQQTVRNGGEGLVLHRANALWSPGRSEALLKFKLAPDDDARVVAHLPGKGRNAGKLGALLLEMPDGQRFALGTGFSDAQRDDPPAIGSVVTYRYRDRTPKGLPRFASFLRVRSPE
jgi:DNA ligase 1